MNILKIDYDKLYSEFWYQTYYKGNKIIFLMSQETLNFIKSQMFDLYFTSSKNKNQKLFNCEIAIANWLPYGDVKLVKEC